MKRSYFDTSALLPALLTAHPHHKLGREMLSKARREGEIICLSMHVYAELYANITRFPIGKKVSPLIAAEMIVKLEDFVRTIDLSRQDYKAALHRCAERQLISGIIYDALHLQAAIKAKVDVLYTTNLRDFQLLYSDDLPFELIGVA